MALCAVLWQPDVASAEETLRLDEQQESRGAQVYVSRSVRKIPRGPWSRGGSCLSLLLSTGLFSFAAEGVFKRPNGRWRGWLGS